ncbi:Nnf1-domain-containing protein [Wilcoxina mikolae CBS 423.85]|nr:Nnf1-domain-containing protein [Wilcoxina mikolae CBS 423.85]
MSTSSDPQPPEPPPPQEEQEPNSTSASQQLHQESSAAAATAAAAEPQEPDGPRSQRLRAVFQKALSKTVATCSYENFSQCFPTTAAAQPQLLHSLHAAMVKNITEKSNIEFEKILQERNVIPKLNALDRLLSEAEKRKREAGPGEIPVAPSTLPPVLVVSAHLTPMLREAQERIGTLLKDMRERNDGCIQEIVRQREEMRELVRRLEEPRRAFEEAVEEVGKAGMEVDL